MDKQECLPRLEGLRAEISAIMELVKKPPLDDPEKEQAQRMRSRLKKKLKDEVRRCQTVREQKSMTDVELGTYCPAILEAANDIRVKTNSTPSRKWQTDLFSAIDGLDWYIFNLKESLRSE